MQVVSVERLVIDTLGQMWGTLIVNCATTAFTALAMVSVCIYEKIAIAVVRPSHNISTDVIYQFIVLHLFMDEPLQLCKSICSV